MMSTKSASTTSERTKRLVCAGLFIALAYVCVFVLHIKVGFLTFDAKDAILTIGALYLGPVYAVIMPLIVALLELATFSDTGIWGCLMNFLSSGTFALVATLIYRRWRTLTGAMVGLVTSAVTMTAAMLLWNILITPVYMGAPRTQVIAMIPTLFLPFNAVKGFLNATFVAMLYRPVTNGLTRAHLIEKHEGGQRVSRKVSLLMTLVALLIAAACIVIFILVLNGQFTWLETK